MNCKATIGRILLVGLGASLLTQCADKSKSTTYEPGAAQGGFGLGHVGHFDGHPEPRNDGHDGHDGHDVILTEKQQKHTNITGYKEGWLTVCVDTPTWLYQMKVERLKILKQLQEEAPDVKNIRFKIGKI